MNQISESSTVKKALSAHAAIGLLASGLLYLVCLTGSIAVFHTEWQRVEQPDAPEMSAISAQAVQKAVETVLSAETQQADHLFVHLPVKDLPRTTLTTDFTVDHHAVHVDVDGNIVKPEENAWSEFLINLHYSLNLPALIGMAVVGALGVMMLVLALSGVIAHPRIFRDAFRFRARDKSGVGLADWHNRLSVWTLPYSVAIALTGALIGLASITAFAVASDSYGGDVERVFAPIFGEEALSNLAPAGIPNVAAALDYMGAQHPDITVTYAIVHEPKTAGQHIQMIGALDKRLVFGEYFNFDANGRFLNISGVADGDLGRQFAASNYNLHFGNFGGLPVKIAYFVFGIALSAICATGTYIWLGKRQRRGIAEPHLRAAWEAIVWGTPLALIATLILRVLIGNTAAFIPIFWGTLAAIILLAIPFASHPRTVPIMRYALAAAFFAGLAIVSVHLVSGFSG